MTHVAILPLVLSACVVDVGHAPAEPDEQVQFAGRTIDYFTKAPVSQVRFETMGLAPEQTDASDVAAAYTLDVPVGSAFFARTDATATHRPTVTDIQSDTADVLLVSRADVSRQHTTAGVTVVADTTAVFVELATFDGSSLVDFPRTNLSIIDPTSQRVVAGSPLVVGPLGDVDPTLQTANGPVTRFVFLNVESGVFGLRVTCPTCQPALESESTLISSAGATVLHVQFGGVQGPPPDSFATIYPLFGTGAKGGLGCANCHHAGTTAPALFDGTPDQVRAKLLELSLVDVAAPDSSPLLTKPLYETPADHPNATFLSASDPNYQAIRAWIAAGAK
jgi:hypothetical protein